MRVRTKDIILWILVALAILLGMAVYAWLRHTVLTDEILIPVIGKQGVEFETQVRVLVHNAFKDFFNEVHVGTIYLLNHPMAAVAVILSCILLLAYVIKEKGWW